MLMLAVMSLTPAETHTTFLFISGIIRLSCHVWFKKTEERGEEPKPSHDSDDKLA